MKQPILAVLLLAIVLVSGYELRHHSHSRLEEGEVAAYRRNRQPSNPSEASSSELADQIKTQERKVAAIAKKAQDKSVALKELDQRRSGAEQDASAGPEVVESLVAQAEARLEFLKSQRVAQTKQIQQQASFEQAQAQGLKVAQELASQRLLEQLQQERASAATLTRQVQELSAINEDLTVLDVLKPRALAGQERVRQLEAQYQAYQISAAQQGALDQSQRQLRDKAQREELQASFDERIQQEQQTLATLQRERQASQHKQAAGQAADEKLSEEYNSMRNEQKDLENQLEVEKIILEDLKRNHSKAATSEHKP